MRRVIPLWLEVRWTCGLLIGVVKGRPVVIWPDFDDGLAALEVVSNACQLAGATSISVVPDNTKGAADSRVSRI